MQTASACLQQARRRILTAGFSRSGKPFGAQRTIIYERNGGSHEVAMPTEAFFRTSSQYKGMDAPGTRASTSDTLPRK